MRISYHGQMKDSNFNTRVAEIDYIKEEESMVREISDIANRETGWKNWSFYNDFDGGCVYVSVEDKKDYDDFRDFYLETKKALKNRADRDAHDLTR